MDFYFFQESRHIVSAMYSVACHAISTLVVVTFAVASWFFLNVVAAAASNIVVVAV